MNSSRSYYIVVIKGPAIGSSLIWVPYVGELTGINDWWNYPPKRFTYASDAKEAIMNDDLFRDCTWQIVKVTNSEEVVEEHIAE